MQRARIAARSTQRLRHTMPAVAGCTYLFAARSSRIRRIGFCLRRLIDTRDGEAVHHPVHRQSIERDAKKDQPCRHRTHQRADGQREQRGRLQNAAALNPLANGSRLGFRSVAGRALAILHPRIFNFSMHKIGCANHQHAIARCHRAWTTLIGPCRRLHGGLNQAHEFVYTKLPFGISICVGCVATRGA